MNYKVSWDRAIEMYGWDIEDGDPADLAALKICLADLSDVINRGVGPTMFRVTNTDTGKTVRFDIEGWPNEEPVRLK